MNVLVTGANGQLGNSIRALSGGSAHRFIFSDIYGREGVETVLLDITDREAVRLVSKSENVDVIVNCAAYTDVDAAESDEYSADLLNRAAPSNLASVAEEFGCALIHISTDYVFGKVNPVPVTPETPAAPCSVYGRTKLAGEKAVAGSGCRYLIIRTAWLYSEYGKNFVKTMLSLTASNSSLKVVCDQVGSPTYAGDLAAAILRILDCWDRSSSAVYHFTGEGAVSWYDFAWEINSLSGHSCRIVPCLSDEFPSKVARPHYSVLDKSSIKAAFGVEIPYWKESLVRCLSAIGEIE